MGIFLKIIIGVAILIAVVLIIALFIKNEYSIEREIAINRPKQQVFDYVRYLKNQDNYSKWVMEDPNMRKDFKGVDGQVGFVYAWDGNDKAGKGEQEIKKIAVGDNVDIEIRFIKPFEGIAQTNISTESLSENKTKVKWVMNGRSSYPMNLTNLFIDNILGKDLALSLNSLKTILEK